MKRPKLNFYLLINNKNNNNIVRRGLTDEINDGLRWCRYALGSPNMRPHQEHSYMEYYNLIICGAT